MIIIVTDNVSRLTIAAHQDVYSYAESSHARDGWKTLGRADSTSANHSLFNILPSKRYASDLPDKGIYSQANLSLGHEITHGTRAKPLKPGTSHLSQSPDSYFKPNLDQERPEQLYEEISDFTEHDGIAYTIRAKTREPTGQEKDVKKPPSFLSIQKSSLNTNGDWANDPEFDCYDKLNIKQRNLDESAQSLGTYNEYDSLIPFSNESRRPFH